jgi:hypothetical protein
MVSSRRGSIAGGHQQHIGSGSTKCAVVTALTVPIYASPSKEDVCTCGGEMDLTRSKDGGRVYTRLC